MKKLLVFIIWGLTSCIDLSLNKQIIGNYYLYQPESLHKKCIGYLIAESTYHRVTGPIDTYLLLNDSVIVARDADRYYIINIRQSRVDPVAIGPLNKEIFNNKIQFLTTKEIVEIHRIIDK